MPPMKNGRQNHIFVLNIFHPWQPVAAAKSRMNTMAAGWFGT